MAAFDDAALRAQVLADYGALSKDVTDATQMGRIFDLVMDATITVRELLHVFNVDNPATQLPAQTLAACFTLLTFSDCIRVSHVCRAWRAAALAHPEVWSTITMDYGFSNRFELFKMALPRAGALPLQLTVRAMYPTKIEDMDYVLRPYVNQLWRVSWRASAQSTLWTRPAPRLEHLDAITTLAITPDFLGGRETMLRSLHIGFCALPTACPALSTVVDLRIGDLKQSPEPSSFRMLFALVPRLKCLCLSGLESPFADDLPPGPAPSSLRDLTLECAPSTRSYNLMRHYLAWGAHRCRIVSLAMRGAPQTDLQPLLQGATVLWVIRPDGTNDLRVVSEHAESVFRSVRLGPISFFSSAPSVPPFLDARGALQDVHTVKLAHNVLEAFLPVIATLPWIRHVLVNVSSTRDRSVIPADDPATEAVTPLPPPRYMLDWTPLSCLPRLPRVLESLTVQVRRTGYQEPPASLADAEALLSVLASLDTRSLPPIEVQGFRDAPGDVHGLMIRFDTTADVSAPGLRIPRPPTFHPLRRTDWVF